MLIRFILTLSIMVLSFSTWFTAPVEAHEQTEKVPIIKLRAVWDSSKEKYVLKGVVTGYKTVSVDHTHEKPKPTTNSIPVEVIQEANKYERIHSTCLGPTGLANACND
ncbi:MAG: hypothetical protein F4Z18_16635 [Caldilineaceae bacterium SB0666_bin_21]|nr:hypothetical protein [Caldilineaceae bacterium SB0666_bin_21]